MLKIHKNPFKFHPIVSCTGTAMNNLSKVVDHHLNMLFPHVKSYLKDGQQLVDDLKTIIVPPNACIFTLDANSMHNNINTPHDIQVISWWLYKLELELSPGYSIKAVKFTMRLVMENNIFEFGTQYFLQLLGTVIGTSAAVMWDTL